MTPTYKVLICQCATGQVMNTDAKTVYSHPAEVEAVIPYHYFDSLAEAEGSFIPLNDVQGSRYNVQFASEIVIPKCRTCFVEEHTDLQKGKKSKQEQSNNPFIASGQARNGDEGNDGSNHHWHPDDYCESQANNGSLIKQKGIHRGDCVNTKIIKHLLMLRSGKGWWPKRGNSV
ncbi:hypothetical protein [Hymenobacter perfusus]|uniref:Uncharacterized protein n=1 Tax=Hymenobacter perfusus TaxID=1236770 RepID=A0A428JWG3_9BACT|nr:hypothetical protein [Hymenobacter perfusus]RSK38434.1 hypothetical protein EI293_21690 [Hymenobacter perfusus]